MSYSDDVEVRRPIWTKEVCDAMIINKIDVLPYFDFDIKKVWEYAYMRNPKLKIFLISAKTGEGMDEPLQLA